MRLVVAIVLCVGLRAQPAETLKYGVEWRFVRAGEVEIAVSGERQTDLKLKSVGLVSTFLTVNDTYRALFDPGWCATSLTLEAHEGRRNRETKVTFDRVKRRTTYLEKDLNTGATVLAKEMEVPACVHEVTGGLQRLR